MKASWGFYFFCSQESDVLASKQCHYEIAWRGSSYFNGYL
jgi:hypothetical protein